MNASGLMKINFFPRVVALLLSKSITVCAFFNELFETNNDIFSPTISDLILQFLSEIITGNITLSFDLTFVASPNLNTIPKGNDSI